MAPRNAENSENAAEQDPVWLEYVQIALGAAFGLVLIAMAVDSIRRMVAVDTDAPAGAEGASGDGAAAG